MKTAEKTPGTALVPQPRGGALLARGRLGNRGGSGRPRDAVRAAMRAKLDEVLHSLAELHAAFCLTSPHHRIIQHNVKIYLDEVRLRCAQFFPITRWGSYHEND